LLGPQHHLRQVNSGDKITKIAFRAAYPSRIGKLQKSMAWNEGRMALVSAKDHEVLVA
jgi:hypothetical protein